MQTFEEIQFKIGAWSLATYGRDEYPLLRITEGVGEFIIVMTEDYCKKLIGSIAVCLCDYCCRENIAFPTRTLLTKHDQYSNTSGLVVWLGRMYHAQRINCESEKTTALNGFVWHLEACAKEYTQTTLLIILNQAWDEIERGVSTESVKPMNNNFEARFMRKV